MDRVRFSLIAHDGIALWNPLCEAETLRLVDALAACAATRVLDVGCGRAELLIRLLARTGASGVGIDSSPAAIALARDAGASRVEPSRLSLRAERFDAGAFEPKSFDVALCVGSTHAAGGFAPALDALHRLLVPGGIALVGEGFWRREPDGAYLEFLGASRGDYLDHAGNLALAAERGFTVERSLVSSERDFDVYEERYAANMERFVASHPDDPEAGAFTERIRAWRAAYLRWGRQTLGFALYVLRRRA